MQKWTYEGYIERLTVTFDRAHPLRYGDFQCNWDGEGYSVEFEWVNHYEDMVRITSVLELVS